MSLDELIIEYGGKEVDAMTVYSDIFKLGQGYIQKENEPPGQFKANPLLYFKNKDEEHGQYRILFEDTFEDTLKEGQEADFSITNGLTYFGRKNVQSHASKMYAMIFDLDGINDITFNRFLYGCYADFGDTRPSVYPTPNYIILSGHNVHLYYIFDEPISLYPNIKLQLKDLKYELTGLIWNGYTSEIKKPQFQGINQGFRPIGAKTKIKGKRVRAFKLKSRPWLLEELNAYCINSDKMVDEEQLFRESKYTLAECEQKYPEWYDRVILNKDKTVKKWDIKNKVHGDDPYALYHWWLKNINTGASYGHRYFCIMTLTIYAIKNGVEFEKLKEDAYGLIDKFNQIKPEEPFTEQDIKSALECYDERYCTFPIKDIEKLTSIRIKRNKRNGRTQEMHLKIARATRDILHENWREGNGRPKGSGTKQDQVQEWRKNHPDGKKFDCHKQTGISRPTIDKWWES